ncbi:MAG: prepilin-type N-terminal cleavage/methylation domain-containing protein [Burkholderiales bacterium]|nr:prepilin-type N-terminal cleavage/methylation domain-containing protein [Burkholderiales bacterium]
MQRRSSGFTLAELTVALVILALLLAGALIPLSTQIEVRAIADTRRSIEQVREALIGFAIANGRLPCPANGATPAGAIDSATWPVAIAAGAEQWSTANNRCFTSMGVVPWAALGVAETDAWGRRFSYRVSPAFSDSVVSATYESLTGTTPPSAGNQSPGCSTPVPAPAQSSFALCSLGDIAVFDRNSATHATTALGAALPAVIVSHGRNGYGAFKPDGARVIGTGTVSTEGVPAQNTDETANASGGTTATPTGGFQNWAFYGRGPSSGSSGCSDATAGSPLCEFDDVVYLVSMPTLLARMVSAGRLP